MSISYNKRVITLNKQHILDYMSKRDFIDTVNAKLQCNYVVDYRQTPPRNVCPTIYNAIIEMVYDGDFLVYTPDIQNYLNNELQINPQNKEYTGEKSTALYASLLARDGEKLYNTLIKKGVL